MRYEACKIRNFVLFAHLYSSLSLEDAVQSETQINRKAAVENQINFTFKAVEKWRRHRGRRNGVTQRFKFLERRVRAAKSARLIETTEVKSAGPGGVFIFRPNRFPELRLPYSSEVLSPGRLKGPRGGGIFSPAQLRGRYMQFVLLYTPL